MKTHPLLAVLALLGAALISQPCFGQYSQQGSKLVGTGAVGTAAQGKAVSLSADGSTAIVGGPGDSGNAGAAWIWTSSGGVWSQQEKLVGSGAIGSAGQGTSVSLAADGNTAIIGGPGDDGGLGAAWAWTRSAGVWTQQGAKLVGSGIVGSPSQGRSVSISADGNTAIVGGPGDLSSGAAWVWTQSAGVWTQQGPKLVGSGVVGAGAAQGVAVGLSADGSTAIVGGNADNHFAGAAWVWTRSAGVWSQSAKLIGSGASANAEQGRSVSLSADGATAIVGGPGDNGTGAAWIWIRVAGIWSQQSGKLVGSDGLGGAQGSAVSLAADGNTAVIGGPLADSAALPFGGFDGNGAAWVWTRSGAVWTQHSAKLVGSGAAAAAEQGFAVSLSADANTILVGGPNDRAGGAVWVFVLGAAEIPALKGVVGVFLLLSLVALALLRLR